MLKTLSTQLTERKKSIVGVGNNSRAKHGKSKLDRNEVDKGKVGDNEVGKKG